jgi:lipoprotein NlpI/transglutaminase-like putative cysteine protease
MYLAKFFRAGVVLAGLLVSHNISAQPAPGQQLKEVQVESNAFTLADPIPSWVEQLPLPQTTSTLPVVVRLADTQYQLGQVPQMYTRRAMLINDAAALTAAGRYSIPFAPEYERVQLHAIRIYRGPEQFDRTSTSNIRFLQREQDLERGMYSGRVTASILIDDVRVGDTIEIAYTTSGQNPVFAGKAFGLSPWDLGLPTVHRRVVLNYPVGRPIAWRVVGDQPLLPHMTPAETVRNGVKRVAFDEQPLPTMTAEAMTAPEYFGVRLVQFSEFTGWNDVAGWANNLFTVSAPRDGEFSEVVKRIKALPSAQARVVAALEFAQSQIRYFSVSLGESSHRPASPDEVLRRRYGDCKDKSLLLVTLLHELGIESKPVLLQMGRHGGLEKTLPSPQFFDHAIVQATVDGKSYFLDPTRLGQHGRLDRMGQAHDSVQVLVVARDTKAVSQVTVAEDIIGDELTERASLARFGEEGQLDVKRVWHGVTAEALRVGYDRMPREQINRSIGDAMERRYPGAKLMGTPELHDDTVNNEFSISVSYRIPKLANEVDVNWVVAFAPDSLQGALTSSPSANRATPLRILKYPFHARYSFEVTFPEQVSGSIDPRAPTISNKYFSASITESFRGNVARKAVDLKTLQTSVEAADYSAYAEDLRALNKAIGGTFFVNKAFVSAAEASKSDLTHRLQEQRVELIKKLNETIGGGKIAGSDLANAHCFRAVAQADLGQIEEAMRDANSAVRLAPNTPIPLACRADVNFRSGQFEKSQTDYANAIALGGGSDGTAFRSRGLAKLFAGRVEDANADFAKASELGDTETRLFSEVWLVATSGRLRKPVPAELIARAAAEAHGDWPRAALAMLTGALSPDEMFKSLDKKAGDERQMALTEAHFYLGQHYLVTGEIERAQSAFEKTRELGVIDYIEYIVAKFELERLKAQGAITSAKPTSAAH